MNLGSLRTRADHVQRRLRDLALRMLDVVPGLQRFVTELVRVEVIDRAMVIAAQALLALIPLLIVMAAFLPHDLGIALAHRFEDITGVGSTNTSSISHALEPDQVRAQFGVMGLLITLFSATSFARSIQRMYERVWHCPHIGGVVGTRRCFVWLAGWLVLLQVLAVLGTVFNGIGPVGVLRLVEQTVAGTLVWWWSAYMLLLGRTTWRLLFPGALITGIAVLAYSRASGIVMPHYASTSAKQLGTLGLVLAATTWLIGLGFVLVVAAVLGRVLAEDSRVHQAVASLRLIKRWSRHHLDQQQHDDGDRQHHEGEGAGRVRRHDVDE